VHFVIGVDIGGTCTDTVVVDETGQAIFAKALSVPSDFSKGILDSLKVAADMLGTDVSTLLGSTRLFLHSTTVAENALVDGTSHKAGLLVTRGFETSLYMTRGGYGRWSGLSEEEQKNIIDTDKPPTLIPLPMIRGVHERVDANGNTLVEASEAEIEKSVRDLIAAGADAIGICFLWAFRNPLNEARAKQVVKRLYPNVFVTASNELVPVEGEYERMSTVALNVLLGPIVRNYLARLDIKLRDNGFSGTVLVMQAHGGLLRAQDAPARAVGMIESGPIGGLVGSKALGDRLGIKNILATDMGGTTFKVGVIRDGRIDYEREPRVYRYHYSLEKMDMVSIGLAGGSIISFESLTGLPKLGPKSAGSDPGPVCYGFGGTDPTVTDVDLILGYLNQKYFLGGRGKLDRNHALQVFKAKLADPLHMDPIEAAGSVYLLANSMMYDLLHKQTVEKGLDPREFTMFVSGGTASMHMPAVAKELGVKNIVIPNSASVHGAFGLVSSDVVYTDVNTINLRLPADAATVNEIYETLTKRLIERLLVAGFKREDVTTDRSVMMRYCRQVHVIPTPVEGSDGLSSSDLDRVATKFETLYAERYGNEAGYRQAGLEMVAFHVRAKALVRKPEMRAGSLAGEDPGAAFVEMRDSYFGKVMPVRCYDFERLSPGNIVCGPAIIWTPITTVVVQPEQTATFDAYKNLFIAW
jgi:N-methylhydantoinase A